MEAHRVLGRRTELAPNTSDHALLHRLYVQLARRGTTRRPILFVIDGIHEVPDDEEHLRQRLLDLLPLGMTGLVAVITDSAPSCVTLSSAARTKSCRLPRFDLHETREYLQDLTLSSIDIHALHRLVNGRPGSLAVLRRIVLGGAAPATLIANSDGHLTDLLDYEWRACGPPDDNALAALALLLYARTSLTVADMSRVLHLPTTTIEECLQRLPFVQRAPSSVLSLEGEPLRRFIDSKVQHLKTESLNALIEDVRQHPDIRQGLVTLPRYFQDAGRLEDLLNYLTPERLSSSVGAASSLQEVLDLLGTGSTAAANLNRDGDLYRFSLQTSTVHELGNAATWDQHLDAALALRAFDEAQRIADSVPLATDRLLLLASIARAQQADGLSAESELVERIIRLLDDSMAALTVEQAIELASRLMTVLPGRATDLVQRAIELEEPRRTVDWAIARLAIEAAVTQSLGEQSGAAFKDVAASLRDRIQDPSIQRVSTALSNSLAGIAASDAIAQGRTIANARDQLFFLRQWAEFNARRSDAILVSERAIDLLIETTEYSPNASDVLRIARPLRYADDVGRALKCASRITALLGDLAERGPTAELHRLRILLAATSFRADCDGGRERYVEEYLAIHDIPDLAIRVECFARFLASITSSDSERVLERVDGLHSLVESDLIESISSTLGCTGNHQDVLEPAVRALASRKGMLVCDLIAMANTLRRRDALRVIACDHIGRGVLTTETADVVEALVQRCETSSAASQCVSHVWKSVHTHHMHDECGHDVLERLSALVDTCEHPSDRARACARAYAMYLRTGGAVVASRSDWAHGCVETSLREIDDAWDTVQVALDATVVLAQGDVECARSCAAIAKTVQEERLGGHYGTSWVVLAPLRLTILALAGLMRGSHDSTNDLERVVAMVRAVPSTTTRIRLLADLAMWYVAGNRFGECRRIVDEEILPDLRKIPAHTQWLRDEATAAAADAVFAARPSVAMSLFRDLGREYRDLAVWRAAQGKLRNLPALEPVEYDGRSNTELSPEDVSELLDLVVLADADATAWAVADSIVSCLTEGGGTGAPAQQRAAVGLRMDNMAGRLFPKPEWIQHDGYLLLWQACSERLKTRKWDVNNVVVQRSRHISNATDRAFMLLQLASLVHGDGRRQLIEEAAAIARTIRVDAEGIEILKQAAECAARVDRKLGCELAKEALGRASLCPRGDMASVQRSAMDVVYRIDRDMASALAWPAPQILIHVL
ncbi:MAG: hypothetical protein IT431_17305 [Phycisphaerales bacterium]|nr:hypothetical protein [Phycisphaerales bacterium]